MSHLVLSLAFLTMSAFALPGAAAQTPGQDWVLACPEGPNRCSIDGTRMIRFGADGDFSYGVATNLFICSSETFGNPAPRTRRSCWFRATARERTLAGTVAERERQVTEARNQLTAANSQIGEFERENTELRAELSEVYDELDRFYASEPRRRRPNRGPRWDERPRRQ